MAQGTGAAGDGGMTRHTPAAGNLISTNMSEPEQTTHWDRLAELLGAEAPSEPEPEAEDKAHGPSPPQPTSPPHPKRAQPKRVAASSEPATNLDQHWGSLASELGVAYEPSVVEPAGPAPAAAPPPAQRRERPARPPQPPAARSPDESCWSREPVETPAPKDLVSEREEMEPEEDLAALEGAEPSPAGRADRDEDTERGERRQRGGRRRGRGRGRGREESERDERRQQQRGRSSRHEQRAEQPPEPLELEDADLDERAQLFEEVEQVELDSDLEPLADEPQADQESPRRTRRTRRRPRPGRPESEPAEADEAEEAEADEADDEEDRPSRRQIPSWKEAVDLVIAVNMAARERGGRNGGAGRSRGGRPNGGGRSGRGRGGRDRRRGPRAS